MKVPIDIPTILLLYVLIEVLGQKHCDVFNTI